MVLVIVLILGYFVFLPKVDMLNANIAEMTAAVKKLQTQSAPIRLQIDPLDRYCVFYGKYGDKDRKDIDWNPVQLHGKTSVEQSIDKCLIVFKQEVNLALDASNADVTVDGKKVENVRWKIYKGTIFEFVYNLVGTAKTGSLDFYVSIPTAP